jgi:peptidoglycan/LPS O-acetylase OafA/YrhL
MSKVVTKIGEIQGLRALAALLVLIFHARFVPGGFIGVDIFYVISGFLITGLLLKELNLNNRISLRAFYLRRTKRLLPASFVVLFATAAFAWLLLPPIARGSIGRDLIATSLYVSNYLFAWWQNDYQNLNATPSPFIHYWSLAVEEQFYIFWPILIVLVAKFRNRLKFQITFLAITLGSFLLGLALTTIAPIWAFYSLPTRAWELSIGALFAVSPRLQIKSKALASAGLLALIFGTLVFNETTAFPGANALIPVLGTAALLSSIGAWPRFLQSMATNRISLWLGKISYPLYLWHWPVLVLPIALISRELSILERILALGLTVLLADLTNRYIEDPIRLRNYSSKVVISAVVLAMCGSFAIGSAIISSTTSAITVNGQRITLESIKAKPAPYKNGCHLNYGQSVSPECAFGDLSATKTMVLYGDSHAAQWFPALEKLANEKGFRLYSFTKSACPAIDVVRDSIGAFQMSNCAAWRKSTIARIAQIEPDFILISSFEHFSPPKGVTNVNNWWAEGSQRTYAQLNSLTPILTYLIDTPRPDRDIPNCLASTAADKCLASLGLGIPQVADFELIDPASWLCEITCPAIVRNNVAYRDASHISVATSLELDSRLWQALVAKGFIL